MNISYKKTIKFKKEELENLFLSMEWSSGKYPEKLVKAMKNSACVISAWDGDKLFGLINALSDGIITAYFHYLLVNPTYQFKGIDKALVEKILEKYEDNAMKDVIAYNKKIEFYTSCGFTVSD